MGTAGVARSPNPTPPALLELCTRRWAIPVLAVLAGSGGAKFVTLCRTLDLPPETMSRTLQALIGFDLVMRNPGYGHPMRPEYILTPLGEAVGPACRRFVARVRELNIDDACRPRWAIPILHQLGRGPRRFGELKAGLPGVTPRALARGLRDLTRAGLIERLVDERTSPPCVSYRRTGLARRFGHVLEELARAFAFEP